jgi:hypothetical protein
MDHVMEAEEEDKRFTRKKDTLNVMMHNVIKA